MKSRETIIVSVLIGLFAISVLLSRSAPMSGTSTSSTFTPNKDAVAIVSLQGVIDMSQNDLFAEGGSSTIATALSQYEKNDRIKAIVLRVNSPGGHVASSQELYNTVLNFRKRSKKPVVVSIVDYGASGAYWVALASDYIFAHPGSMVGSLGVITQTMDLTRFKEKYNVGVKTFKSGQFKDMLNPWRTTTTREKAIVERLLKNIHRQFTDVLIERRKLDKAVATNLADGRIYTGEQALEWGLIDAVGGLKDAIDYAAKLGNIKGEPRVIRKSQTGLQRFFQSMQSSVTSLFSFPQLGQSSIQVY